MPENTTASALPTNAVACRGAQAVVSPRAQRQNGFDILRIVAAIMVLYGHAFPLTGNVSPGFLSNGIQTIGVKIFFIISGFLITRSWLADANLVRYTQRRAARIMPGLVLAVLACALVIGPIFTSLSLVQYFKAHTTWQYLRNIVLHPIYSLPGVFQANVYPNAVNGSLWSLPAEVLMYVLTPIIIGKGTRGWITLPLFTTATIIGGIYFVRMAPPAVAPVYYGSSMISLADVALYFQIGGLYAVFNLDRYTPCMASLFLLAAAAWTVHAYVLGELMLILFLPLAVIGFGRLHFSFWDRVTRGTDISYGLYLYGFPLQQAVGAVVGRALTPYRNFLIALPLTILCAVASWHLVERRGLLLKPRRVRAKAGDLC